MLSQFDSAAQNNTDSVAWKQQTVRLKLFSVHKVQEVVNLRRVKSLEKAFCSQNGDSQLPSAGKPRPLSGVVKIIAHWLLDFGVSFLVKVHVTQKVFEEVQYLSSVVI